jgi:hypothetical protein
MIIYFAGNITVQREREFDYLLSQRLFSYHYHGNDREFNEEFRWKINDNLSGRGTWRK